MRNNRVSLLALMSAGLLWGTTVPLTKLALGWLGPGWLTVARFALAAVLLAWPVRHKLRARIYTDDPSQVEWVRLEVKSRILATIHKIACDVSREDWDEIWSALQARTLPRSEILDRHRGVMGFFRLQKQYSMEPKIMVQYRRTAWERQDLSRVRTNFDDDLIASRDLDLLGPLNNARRLLQYGNSVFEIKVDGVMPYWLHMLTDKYGLQNQAFSKFCNGIISEARKTAVIRDE